MKSEHKSLFYFWVEALRVSAWFVILSYTLWHALVQELAAFSVKDQIIILGFVGHMVLVAATQLCCSAKTTTDNT